MADSVHWICVSGRTPHEISQKQIEENFVDYEGDTFLVPGYVWRDFQKTRERLDQLLEEIKSYGRPRRMVVADNPRLRGSNAAA